jgi:phosphatidylserine/phosphatidylglycerophosphate/cardiolipin synthase-like enzyme
VSSATFVANPEKLNKEPAGLNLRGGIKMRCYATVLTFLIFLGACGINSPSPTDSSELEVSLADLGLLNGSPEARAVLSLVNDPQTTFETLDITAGLDRRAAANIVAYRAGPDGIEPSADDDRFDTIEALDAVAYVGGRALSLLLEYARDAGFLAGFTPITAVERARTILAVVNDIHVSFTTLDDTAALDRRAARNIISYRDGADAVAGTNDDIFFVDIPQLDGISYVGKKALSKIFDYGLKQGYHNQGPVRDANVIFSPKLYAQSHNLRVAQTIDSAQHSLDIAMYSYSDATIATALQNAVQRGVQIRFVFHTASSDRRLDPAQRGNTKSGRLEAMGIDVRWVNKIMHHKFMIVDGPRDDLSLASTAKIVTGSGNWSNGAATRYDENTLFLTGYAEIALRMQREFNLLWNNARDFEHMTYDHVLSAVQITDADIVDDPNVDVLFTSSNFSVSNTTFRSRTGYSAVSDALVAAINNASDSILVASGHLRSRPVAEALMNKRAQDPTMEIRVMLDSQEYISAWMQGQQLSNRNSCLIAAGTSASRIRKCNDKGFRFGYEVGNSGIDVRYKYYAYRWDYSYALQMHHKFMIIDGEELWTGSYNLSDNAEHNTFENILVFRGAENAALIAQYVQNFDYLWTLEQSASTYQDLLSDVNTSSRIPLVFTPMALDWNEVTALRNAIRSNCADINTNPYRLQPENHRFCYR